jgi:catechol 2,3-dioxygenase-like lactoylglutathione lyase family enzyme
VGARVHLSLNVRDLAQSVTFYQAFLGVPPHKERPGYANFASDNPPLKLALNEKPDLGAAGAGSPLNHLGFQMVALADVQQAKERLLAAGLATWDENDTTCCYARQEKIWVHDPDGNAWEVYVITDDQEDDHDHDHLGQSLTDGGLIPSTALFVPGGDAQTPARVPCCQPE